MMNNLLQIHNCVQVALENENLLKINSSLEKENKFLFQQIESYKRYLNRDLNNNGMMIDVATQVNIHSSYYDQVYKESFALIFLFFLLFVFINAFFPYYLRIQIQNYTKFIIIC